MDRAKLILLLGVLVTQQVGCSSRQPTPLLLAGLESQMPSDVVRHKLGGRNWQLIWDTALRDPAFRSKRIRIEPADDLGVPGVLELDFLNDKLERAAFFPADSATYRQRLTSRRQIRFDAEGESQIPPNTHVYWSTEEDHLGRSYFSCADRALTEERHRAES